MDRTFQIPMQYVLYSIRLYFHHQTHPTEDFYFVISHFYLDPAASFFLELLVIALCSSPVTYWIPSGLWGSSSVVISFCLFILSIGLSRQEYWSGLLFPPLVGHILSELFTMTCPSYVTLHGMIHSFTKLFKPLFHDTAVIDKRDIWYINTIFTLSKEEHLS